MIKRTTIVISSLAALIYLAFAVGAFITAWEGFNPPNVKRYMGIVTSTDCEMGKYDYAWLKIGDINKEFYPHFRYFSDNCTNFDSIVYPGQEVVFLATNKGKLWSLHVNNESIYGYEEYKEERALLAPFFLVIGVFSILLGPLFYWAHKRDKRRKNIAKPKM